MEDLEDSGEECLGEDFLEVEEVWVDLDALDLEDVRDVGEPSSFVPVGFLGVE